MKRYRDEAANHLLGGNRKGRLALTLAEIELGDGGDDDLNNAIGDLTGKKLIEPDTVKARMLSAHFLEDFLPNRRVESRFGGATRHRLALDRRLGQCHGDFSAKND